MTLQSGTKGAKDKQELKRDPPDEPRDSKETSDIAQSKSPRTDTSNDVLKELWTASSINSPPVQDAVDNAIQFIFATPGLAEHRYINLMEYSVLRAFLQNASLLAIDPVLFADDYALSPWTTSTPYPALAPHDLSPTLLQLSTPHHPYLDMIAPPSLRDNILLSVMTDEQEDQLCHEMHCDSFTIWGSQPWNALGP